MQAIRLNDNEIAIFLKESISKPGFAKVEIRDNNENFLREDLIPGSLFKKRGEKPKLTGKQIALIPNLEKGEYIYMEVPPKTIWSYKNTILKDVDFVCDECIVVEGKMKEPLARRITKITRV